MPDGLVANGFTTSVYAAAEAAAATTTTTTTNVRLYLHKQQMSPFYRSW